MPFYDDVDDDDGADALARRARKHFLPSMDELGGPARFPGVGRAPREEGEEPFGPGSTAGGLDLGPRSEEPEDADADAGTITVSCPHCGERTKLLPPKGWRFVPREAAREADANAPRHLQWECENAECAEPNRLALRKHVLRRATRESETGSIFRRAYRERD